MEKNWDENKINELINECIIIENNINDINKINEEIKKCKINSDLIIILNLKKRKKQMI